MRKSGVALCVGVVLSVSFCHAGPRFSVVGSTYVDYATAYSNGHKIVGTPPVWDETLYVVYGYDENTCRFAQSHDRGYTWQSREFLATLWGNSRYPSLDIYRSMPYVVSQGDSGDRSDIFLKCPLDYCIPQRVSNTEGHSSLPAIVIDDGAAHIVWQDDSEGDWEIYYCCAHYDTSVGDVVNLSNAPDAYDRYPSIGIYDGSEVHVVWERYDTLIDCPYSIARRYLASGNWSDEEYLAGCTGTPLHHPSLDYSHGEDHFSAAWEDSSLGTSNASFYGGNGGGFPTSGDSRYPVISTMGCLYSYLYWEDDTDGRDDIYGHQYYSNAGWTQYSLRDWFEDEKMRYPSVANGYMVWTHGESPPWKVVFHHYEYPVAVDEGRPLAGGERQMTASPSLFGYGWEISYSLDGTSRVRVRIYDTSGRLTSTLVDGQRSAGKHRVCWDASDDAGRRVPSGTYFVRLALSPDHHGEPVVEYTATQKLVVLR